LVRLIVLYLLVGGSSYEGNTIPIRIRFYMIICSIAESAIGNSS